MEMAEAKDVEGQIRQNLKDAACPDDLIESFMRSIATNHSKDGQRLLSAHRKSLLDTVHENQRHIDCLDYLLYRLNKGDF